MKKLFTLSLVAFAFILGSFTSFAQESNIKEIYESSKKKAFSIAEQINLDDDERLLLVRQIATREETLVKVEINQNNPDSTNDLSKYVTMANQQFKKNIVDLFGEDKANKILSIYEVED